ncbi:MAG: DMT family transporter [Thermoproteota archaeon]|jgi:drug/metabolite transporter (DMT)-like permease
MKLAVLAELITIFLWSLGNIFIAYLNLFFDNYTQNFFRYISAAVTLLLFSLAFNKNKYFSSLKNLKALTIPILTVFIFQIFNVYGIAFTTPTIATLITRLSVIFVDILSFFLFSEERVTLTNKNFIVGTLLSLFGVSGVVLVGSSLFYSKEMFFVGVLFLVLTSILWAIYIVSIKVALRNSDPLSTTTNVFLISGVMYFPFSVFTGGIYKVFNENLVISFLLIISGILSIGIGNFLNYYAIQELGASISTNLQLLIPVVTGILSVVTLNEPMPFSKVVFSLLTLVGCWLVLKALNRENKK